MAVFARVATTRSFSLAARELGISQATASKHVQTLEAWFGAPLLHRTTRRVGLTEAGEGFLSQCMRILEDVDSALQGGNPNAPLRGTLRLSAPITFDCIRLGPLLAEFIRRNPELSVLVMLNDQPADAIEDGFDLALTIRTRTLEVARFPQLVVQRLAVLGFVVCASPTYLEQHGTPATPPDLADHLCVTGTEAGGEVWRFAGADGELDVPVNGRFKTDNRLLRHRAVLGGAGVLLEPEFLAADDIDAGRLTRLMPDYPPVSATLEAVCPTHRAATPKVRSLVAFLMERLNA